MMRNVHGIAGWVAGSVLLAGLAGCGDEEPTPIGRFDRPAGLVYVPRAAPADSNVVDRADLFIADSEAQGVRVLQLGANEEGAVGFNLLSSPAVFFPLAISTPGFPSEISAAVPASGDVERLYALTVNSRGPNFHVLEIAPAEFGADSMAASNIPVGALDLAEVVPQGVPVDLEVVRTGQGGQNTSDVVAVLFDGALTQSPSVLALITVQRTPEGVSFSDSSTVAVGSAPRALLLRERQLLVSSAAEDVVRVFVLDREADAASMVTGSSTVGVGGPAGALVDVPGKGALALRLDRSAAVVLEESGDTLARLTSTSSGAFSPRSPYTPSDETPNADQLGRIDLQPSPVVTGAHGLPGNLFRFADVTGDDINPADFDLLNGASSGDVVLLAHADGRASFLIGWPPQLGLSAEDSVARINQVDGPGAPKVAGCVNGTCPESASSERCTDEGLQVLIQHPPGTVPLYRATAEGALARSRSLSLELLPGTSTTATAAASFQLTDPLISDFAERQVSAGDRVMVNLPACPQGVDQPGAMVALDGRVEQVDGPRLNVFFDAVPLSSGCDQSALPTASYEVYPGDGAWVLARFEGEQLIEVVQRALPSANTVAFSQNLQVNLELAGGEGCTVSAELGALCLADSDCRADQSCEGVSEFEVCSGRCQPCGEAEAPVCSVGDVVRSCSSIELLIDPTGPFEPDLANRTSSEQRVPVAAPSHVIFSPLSNAWLISYPGSRLLAEFRVISSGFSINHIR